MKRYNNNKESRKKIKELMSRFLNEERLTANDIVSEYFIPKSPLSHIFALTRARSWLGQIDRKFNKQGVSFGRCGFEGEYGIIKTQQEAMYAGTRAYSLVKGYTITTRRKIKNLTKDKLLQSEEELITLPAPKII